MLIRMPRFPEQYADRELDCQQALEDMFLHVLAMAEQYGWTREESIAAMHDLAEGFLCQIQANAETDGMIESVGETKH